MLITVIVEGVAMYLLDESNKNAGTVNILYCCFTAFEFEYYLFVISFSTYNATVKKIIFGVLVVYPVLVFINMYFIQPQKFHTITYSLGCLLVVTACINYFFELFQSTNSVNLVKEPAFWICSALLFFYCCTFPLVGLWNHLSGLPEIILKNLGNIMTLINVLLYCLFSIACLCTIRFRRSIQ